MKRKLISIIAPMYNEEKLVEEYCNEVYKIIKEIQEKYEVEVLLINDGSEDKTYEKMLKMKEKYSGYIKIFNLSRNFGLEGAINAGLKKSLGDAVVVMDADLQDPPRVILDMIKKWENGADIVVGSRIKRKYDNLFKRITAKIYYKILDLLSGKLKLEKSAANFRLLSRYAVNELLFLPEVNPVFRVTVPFIGMKTDVVEYSRDKRYAGKSKYKIGSMIRYALDSITGISIEPLRKIVWLPIFTFIMCIIFFIIGLFIEDTDWFKFILMISSLLFCTTLIMICLALLAEYIGQIMIEVKRRPMSIIYKDNK